MDGFENVIFEFKYCLVKKKKMVFEFGNDRIKFLFEESLFDSSV